MNVYINDDFCDFYWGDLSPEEMNEERLSCVLSKGDEKK